MGVMRFQVPPQTTPDPWPEVSSAYVSGYDGRVFPCRLEYEDGLLAVRRQVTDSGRLHVAWPVEGFGRPILATSSLPEQEEPYLLPLELARGKLAQLRDQLSVWSLAGMTISDEVHDLRRTAQSLFAKAACARVEDVDASSTWAMQALEHTCEAADRLTRDYASLRLRVRSQRTATLPVAFGCQLGHEGPSEVADGHFEQVFTSALIPIEWKRIEPEEGTYNWETNDRQVKWGQDRKLMLCGGPLLDFSPNGLPAWLHDWDHDFFNLQSFVCDFIETAITRYVGTIRLWEVVARANTDGALSLTEENRLNLIARAFEVARAVDEETQLLIRVDQPWSDYQARGQHRLAAWQFVDVLSRMGSGVSAINLEFAIGYRPHGCHSRDLLEFSQLLDLWSQFGLPLFVTLACPSSAEPDPNSRPDRSVAAQQWSEPWSPTAQARWLEAYLPLILAKQAVVGVFWTHLSDDIRHDFPHAGLFDHDRQPKPGFQTLKEFRDQYWAGAPGQPGHGEFR